MVWITTGKSLYVTKANDTQTCLTWNSYPYVANNSTWHTSIFDMKQLSMCGKQQEMTYNHVWHETVVHDTQTCAVVQTTANDIQAFLTWNSCPYVANNSKWHTSILTWNSCPYVANNSKWHTNMFDMKQLSICGKQQQMTQKHFWHETVVHMWQTTANDTQACLTWNSYPYVANNSKWHTSILTWNSYPYVANNSKWHTSMFDMKQLSICGKQQQMTHMKQLSMFAFLTWNSYPYVANNSKWHTRIFDMKQLSMFYLFIYLKYILPFCSQAVKLTIYTGRKTKIFTYNIRK